MQALYGTGGAWTLLLVTLLIFGGASFLTGQAVAGRWRPAWQVVLYALLLTAADRFIVFALFGGPLLSPLGFVADAVLLVAIGLVAYRLTQAWKMVQQYPWLYRPAGPFGWRPRDGTES